MMGGHVPWVIDGADVQVNTGTGEILEFGESRTRVERLSRRDARLAAARRVADEPQAVRNARGRAACEAAIPVRVPVGLQRSGGPGAVAGGNGRR